MESELPDNFQLKIDAKNILRVSLGTQRQAVFAIWCLLLKKQTNFLNQIVTLQCFPCQGRKCFPCQASKEDTSLIYE